jgi:hypothetical protein
MRNNLIYAQKKNLKILENWEIIWFMPKRKFSKKLNSYVMIEIFLNYMQKGKFLLNYNFLF